MNVKLTEEILNLQEQKKDLSYLIQTIVRKKHNIIFDSGYSEVPKWLDPEDQDTLELYFQKSMIGDTPTSQCEVVKDASNVFDDKVFSIREAIDYTETPLTVMVENSNNDSNLILLALDLYTHDKTHPYYDNRIAFGHAGGCGAIKGVLTEKLRQNGERPKMLRYYVIVDGDRRYDTHTVDKYNNLKDFLNANHIPFHIFEKRCMENYMPCEAFPNKEQNRNWLRAFQALKPIQRDLFNISGGLKGDLTEANRRLLNNDHTNIRLLLCDEQQTFYSDVSETNLQRLAEGYVIRSFKDEFPKGFTSSIITREMMDNIQQHQCNPHELHQIAAKIADLL